MKHKTFSLGIAFFFVSIGLTALFGCDGGADAMAAPAATASADVKAELQSSTTRYIEAVRAHDVGAVERLISAELRKRIETRGPKKGDFASNLDDFVSREQKKLKSTFKGEAALEQSVTVTSSTIEADGKVATVEMKIGDAAVPKPFYLVRENGAYKVNVVKPEGIGTKVEGNVYNIQNDDASERNFRCSSGGSHRVAPHQHLQSFCRDSCAGYFDGTRFKVGRSSADCDYNTYGVDMFIRGNKAVCNGPC